MRTFSIHTLGCKVNQYESQQVRQLLEQAGLTHVLPSQKADLAIFNTCCVTGAASAKSRNSIRRVQKSNPAAVIVVCGCLPSIQTDELKINGKIHLIKDRRTLAYDLSRMISGGFENTDPQRTAIKTEEHAKSKSKNNLCGRLQLPRLTSFKGHSRAFLKVQDGCDGYCSYCIIPKTRPQLDSMPVEAAMQEAAALAGSGHKEIVLTGIFLGAFGQDTVRRKDWPERQNGLLAELLDKIAEEPGLERIRLSSLEPADVTEGLLDCFRRHSNIMPHLHLSLQSGSNRILKRMCRQYDADQFRQKVDLIRSMLDRPAITADIIVGFPGETEEDFQETVEMAKQTGFSKMHVFAFSPRKHTAAANYPDQVIAKVAKQRSEILRRLDVKLGHDFREQFIGQTAAVLIEDAGLRPSGLSERYFTVYLDKELKVQKNDIVTVRLTANTKDGMRGEIVIG